MKNKLKITFIIIGFILGFILFILFQLYLIKEYGYKPLVYKMTG